jgi:membrane protein DedA with SNARE-associated domain
MVEQWLSNYGLILLFALVALESFGVPLPGETALIAASVLAERGHFRIQSVIAVAATAAIVGDNAGYWVGRTGGRKLLTEAPVIKKYVGRVLPRAERFFARHGAKTVFIGRFVAVLRFTAAWLAGISHMPWWRFLAWNAAGGIAWATLVGLLSFFFGRAVGDAIGRYGAFAGVGIVALIAVGVTALHLWRRRLVDEG